MPDRCAALIAVLLGLVFLHLASSAPVGAQPRPNQPSAPSIEDRPVIEARAAEREHFQLKIGPSYDEGDFGTSQKTRTFFFPFTLRYLGERWDLGVTTSFVRLDAPGNVVIVDGQPQNTRGAAGAREVNSGFGDMVLKGRYYVVDAPDGYPLVLWSWSFESGGDALAANEAAIRGVTFAPILRR